MESTLSLSVDLSVAGWFVDIIGLDRSVLAICLYLSLWKNSIFITKYVQDIPELDLMIMVTTWKNLRRIATNHGIFFSCRCCCCFLVLL